MRGGRGRAEGEPLTFLEMTEHLTDAELAPQKIPEQLELVDALPRNPTGKVLKRDLRAAVLRLRADDMSRLPVIIGVGQHPPQRRRGRGRSRCA